MLALLIKYKVALLVAALLGALGLGGAGVAAANGALPLPVQGVFLGRQSVSTQLGVDAAVAGAARQIVHGSVIVQRDGAWRTYTLDVGSVTSASSSAISLKRADGSSVTLAVTATTRWGARGMTTSNLAKKLSKLQGREVAVLSQNGAADLVGGRGVIKGFAYADVTIFRNGKTREVQLARGTVQSVSTSQISLMRADGVTYSATLTSTTRYRQAGVKGSAQASAVKPGEKVALLVSNGLALAVRIAKS
jgi:hypothetical protein